MVLSSEKADVEVVGHVILLSLTITGISLITLVGVPAIYSLQEMANVRDAEQAYTVLDSRASKVALGDAQQQIINFNLGGSSLSVKPNSSAEPSYVLFELKNESEITRIPIDMGKIVYRLGDREVAYEGGGVWSRYPEGSVMLSPPEFNYNGVTTTFPIVNISGNFSAGGNGVVSLNIEKKGPTRIIYPDAANPNPLDANITAVTIIIKSEYYDAWADYFRSITLTRVNTSPDEKKVTVTLETPPVATNFSYGALASEKIVLKNNGETDSYNSTEGSYSTTKSENGSIRATKKIEMNPGSLIRGNALTGGDITGIGAGTRTIKGYACANSISSNIVVVNSTPCPAVEGLDLGDTANLVQRRINEYKANNNNNDSSAGGCLTGAANRTLDGSGAGWDPISGWNYCTISSGNYYLTKFELENKINLTFDTDSGAINIALDSDEFEIDNRVEFIIKGNNSVRLYLDGEIDFGNNIKINHNSNEKSSLFQIISSTSQQVDFGNGDYYSGFIWSPYAKIVVSNIAEVYGALIGREFVLENGEKMHYDEALQSLETQITEGTTVRYLYITRNDVGTGIS